jgi:hypothetical protein
MSISSLDKTRLGNYFCPRQKKYQVDASTELNMKIASSGRNRTRRRRYLLAAGYSLTSSLIATTLQAEQPGDGKKELRTGVYPVKSALPFLPDRYLQVRPLKRKPEAPAGSAEPIQSPTALSGDTR